MLSMPLFDFMRLAHCSLLLRREILARRIHLIPLILFIYPLEVLMTLSRLPISMNIGLLESPVFRHHHGHDRFLGQRMIGIHVGSWL